ncbi:MAG: competence/damage-inducible protein A [Clostridia bacterium]|nr:competence/damage-inducible protein A [Clostridia bacterium]
MRVALLTVGTEILFGQIVNTNAAYLSSELQNLGFDVMYHYTVGDNPMRLKDTLRHALSDCDMVITTGGLGPTEDDLTKEMIAEVMNDEIVTSEEYRQILVDFCNRHNYPVIENNLKQANVPKRARIFSNSQGTAPGFLLENEGKYVAALPGPPREMKAMFQEQLKPELIKMQDAVIYYRVIRTFGIGEAMLETKLLPLIDGQTDPTIATYAKEGEASFRICSKRKTLEEAKKAVDDMIVSVNQLVGEYIYSYDDEELVDVVGKMLIEKNISISACESCTCGMFTSRLGSVSGISQVLERGIVTYTERAKMEELGVKQETIDKYTVVSPEVAIEMVTGLKEKTGSDICISITGYMGPGGGTEKDPVATAYIGVSYKDKVYSLRHYRRDVNREWNRNYAVLKMLYEVYKNIKED